MQLLSPLGPTFVQRHHDFDTMTALWQSNVSLGAYVGSFEDSAV